MVNCKNCGAPLSLDSPVCPNCGTPNPEAQEHLRKLAKLDKEYKKVKLEVVSEVQKSRKGYNVLTMLIVVLLANLILIPFHAASWDIAERIVASRKGVNEIKQELDSWLDQNNYDAFCVTFDKYEANYRKFEEYNPIYYQAVDLVHIKSLISNYLYSKTDYTDPLMDMCNHIKRFFDDYDYAVKRDYYSDFTVGHIKNIHKECCLYLKTFLKLNDEDIASIDNLSSSELLVLVSRRLNNEE